MFDVIIAGAGSAGCVLANRLTEDPTTRVLLLEAGPRDRKLEIAIPAAFPKLFGSKADWGFETEPEPGAGGRRVFFPRGRTLGGSSSTNALMWVPGHRADFEAWDALGWGHEAVLPWLRRAAEVMAPEPLRDRNPMTAGFLDAARERGWRSLPDLSDLEITPVQTRTRAPVSLMAADSPVNLARWLVRRRGMLASLVGQAAAFVCTRPELTAPDLELLFAPVLFVDEGRTPPPEHGFTIGPVVLKPRSRGSVSQRSPDPLDAPAIAPGYLSDPGDRDTMLLGIELARELLRSRGLAPWMDGELAPGDVDDLDAWARGSVQGLYHPVGTCAIGAVVDPELRVRGIDALRVVDASVLPDIVRGHTNAITLTVAERAAAVIRGQARVAWSGWADSSHPTSSSSPAAVSSARHG
jgi:choline dehydrogenase-like flavoprotein